jgi:DNA-binding response OmpR family regulator
VIVVTGREDASAIDRAFDAGATSFLVKPINWRLLSYQIRYVMRAGRAETKPEPQPAAAAGGVSEQALLDLAREGAALIRLAMRAGPDLRHSALAYAALLADTVGPQPPQLGHG